MLFKREDTHEDRCHFTFGHKINAMRTDVNEMRTDVNEMRTDGVYREDSCTHVPIY